MKVIGYILCCVFLLVTSSTSVGASSNVSWVGQQPDVYRSEVARYESRPYCPTYLQSQRIEGVLEEQQLCMFDAADIRVATGSLNYFGWRVLVAYPLDSSFHLIENVCVTEAGCVYAADTDILIERFRSSQLTRGLHVFKHAKARIHRVLDGTTGTLQYVFDRSQPEYTITGEDDQVLPIGSFGVSGNGQWVGFEIPNEGTGRMDLLTGEKRRLEATGIMYGLGADPVLEIAISNDGTHVAIMGEGTNLRIVESVNSCGHTLVPLLPDAPLIPPTQCPVVVINPSIFTNSFYAAFHPAFDALGGQLTFYEISYGEPTRRVSLRAPNYQNRSSLQYLAMGDSFSSGEGESDDAYYLPGTNDQYEKCHTSRRSYPFLLARVSGIADGFAKSIACAGAVMEDIVGSDTNYEGQKRRLGVGGRMLSSNDREAAQTSAIDSFIPGRALQSRFLKEYEPTLLTVGIGGNDAGFMTKLKTCAMPGRCEWASNQEMIHRTGIEIRNLFDRFVSLYQQLQQDSPHTKIVAVGYPEVINRDGVCDPLTTILLDHDERVFMNEGLHYLNQVIKAAAYRTHVMYVDIEHALSESRLCDGGERLAMNGLRVGDDISLVTQLPMLKIIGNESFHPNPYGHERIATSIVEHYGNLLTYECSEMCVGGDMPALDNYWAEDTLNTHESVTQRAYQFSVKDEVSPDDAIITIDIPRFTFQPHSLVQFELHSKSLQLGELQSDEFGAVYGTLAIPDDIEEGHHALHAVGTSYGNKALDVYQGITYGRFEGDTQFAIGKKDIVGGIVDKIATLSGEITPLNTQTYEQMAVKGVLGSFRAVSVLPISSVNVTKAVLHMQYRPFILVAILIILGTLIIGILQFKRRQKKVSQDRGG